MPISLVEQHPARPPLRAVGAQHAHPPATAGTTVLVIDDDPDVRELLTAQLTGEGFLVLTACDGPSGLAAARTSHPDIILLDVRMPQMSGFDVCAHLRQDRSTAHVPVLILSAYATAADIKLLGSSVGADGYLLKPYYREDLVNRVRALLARAA